MAIHGHKSLLYVQRGSNKCSHAARIYSDKNSILIALLTHSYSLIVVCADIQQARDLIKTFIILRASGLDFYPTSNLSECIAPLCSTHYTQTLRCVLEYEREFQLCVYVHRRPALWSIVQTPGARIERRDYSQHMNEQRAAPLFIYFIRPAAVALQNIRPNGFAMDGEREEM
jgi:hypothetical protein